MPVPMPTATSMRAIMKIMMTAIMLIAKCYEPASVEEMPHQCKLNDEHHYLYYNDCLF